MIEAETPAGAENGPDALGRVVAAAAFGIATPFRDAAGVPDPETVDMPALAMATVAAPVGVALAGRFLEGLVAGGLASGIAFALAGAVICAVMASLAVVTLWAVEVAAARAGKLREASLPRAYAYALAFLCTCGLPSNGFAGLCLLALTVATLTGCFRRVPGAATPSRLAAEMTGPAIGFLAFHVGVTVFIAARIQAPLIGMVAGLLAAVFG